MPVDEAVIDSPALDATAETPVGETGAEPVVTDAPVEGATDVKGDERKIKQAWRELKASHPDLYSEYKSLRFGKDGFDEKWKGFDLDGTRSFLDEHGGREGLEGRLQELAGKSEELDGLYEKINNGDVSVVESIPDEALEPIARAAFERYAQTNPDGWQAYQANVFAATISQAGILPFLDKMSMMLQYNDTANLPKLVDDLKGWAQSFSQAAQQNPQLAGKQAPQGKQKSVADERKAWENERDTKEYAGKVATEAQTARDAEIGRQLAPFIERRKGDADAKDAAYRDLNNQVNARMSADEPFQKQLMALGTRRDIQGALRLINSREKMLIGELAPKVGRAIFGNPSQQPPVKKEEVERRPVDVRAAQSQDPKRAFLGEVFAR